MKRSINNAEIARIAERMMDRSMSASITKRKNDKLTMIWLMTHT